jgi:SAM-dependent methyltransferase
MDDDRPSIGSTLISARSLAEYVAMFTLTPADLRGSILDCPGGAASFTAERSGGFGATLSVDPVYATDADWLAEHAVAEAIRGNLHTAAAAQHYAWTFFRDVADHRAKRIASATTFGAHRRSSPSSYIPAALPHLPLRDRSFDLVLSSHLLFMYADRLDVTFHVASLVEMTRVCRHEVRVFPLVSDAGDRLPELRRDGLHSLADLGLRSEIRPSGYEFQLGGNEMLVVHPAAPRGEGPGPSAPAGVPVVSG